MHSVWLLLNKVSSQLTESEQPNVISWELFFIISLYMGWSILENRKKCFLIIIIYFKLLIIHYFFTHSGKRSGLIHVGNEKWMLPLKFKDHANTLYNFNTRSSDTWIVTYPRSGTTWTQEMIWLISNNLNFKRAKKIPLTRRFPFLEWVHMMELNWCNLKLNLDFFLAVFIGFWIKNYLRIF